MTARSLCFAFALGLALAAGSAPLARAQTPKTEEEKTVYAIGLAVAQNLRVFGLSESELALVVAGLRAGVGTGKPELDVEKYRAKMDTLAEQRRARSLAAEHAASSAQLERAAAQRGAVRLGSGLVYRETRAGNGASPHAKSKVRVHYTGTLRDGTVFDSSRTRGAPDTFPLARMIPCWIEALPRMKVGGAAELDCPAELAYGEDGAPPGRGDRVPPGAAIHFELELLGVEE